MQQNPFPYIHPILHQSVTEKAQAAAWLELAGCKKIFYTSAYTGEGIADILSYLKEERDTLPWEEVKSKYDELGFGAGEDAKDQNRFHNI